MINNKNLSSTYIRVCNSSSVQTEKSIKERLLKENPKLANNPHQLRIEVLNRASKKMCVDSSYYLG